MVKIIYISQIKAWYFYNISDNNKNKYSAALEIKYLLSLLIYNLFEDNYILIIYVLN